MNVSKLFLMVTFVTSYACAMEERLQLSVIEKQLIVKEVKERGKEKILAEIRTETKKCTPIVYDEKSDLCFFRYYMGFKINKKFYQKDINNDLLTKQIFEFIQQSENKKDQRPDASWNAKSNVLGKRTQYWWIKDADENSLSGIQVQFRPHYYSGDQKAVEEVVQSVVDEIKEEKCLKLSEIEKLLVLQQVAKQGKDHFLAEVRKEREYGPMQLDEERQVWYRVIPMALEIEETFYKENIEKDLLTKTIFSTIQGMENQNKHCPNCHVKKEDDGLCPECHVGINMDQWEVLGYRTGYEWIEDTQSNFPAIKMTCLFKARPYDQQGLEEFINDYHQNNEG